MCSADPRFFSRAPKELQVLCNFLFLMEIRQEYKVITLNVNGLHNPIKRNKALAKMKREKQDIIFWQETHLSAIEHNKLCKMGFKNVFYSSYVKKHSRGVAILLSDKVHFQLSSQIRDKEGRYILVKGYIDHKEVTLFNVYRPPGTDKHLIKTLSELIATETSGILICGGDWNIHLNQFLDTSSKTKLPQPEAVSVKRMLKELGLFDVWRDAHSLEKKYTFFSHSHHMYSRLDYFFMSHSDKHRILNCDIGVRDISDHAGVYLTLHLDSDRKESLWRLNTSLLNDVEFERFVKKEFKEYMDYNNNGDVSPSILWDAAKAVLRGKLIWWSSYKKKEKEKYLIDLTTRLKHLESEHVKSNNDNTLSQIKETQQILNRLYEDQIEKRAKFIKQNYYENGPKSKRLLAWRIRKQQADRFIQKIKNPANDKICHDMKSIKESFVTYYTRLYAEPHRIDVPSVNVFLSSLDLPSIGTEQNKRLTQTITVEEINKAISKLKGNKMAGEDGYPAEWYKHFRDLVTPLLRDCFNHVLTGGEIPPSWKRAVISVIPKAGKNRTECGSYRPISVLNIDYRIFATILAKRLEFITSELTDTDQTGFVRNRQTHDNVRRALHLINKMKNIESIAVSLDAEKAFDSVCWNYLYLALERFGFNSQIIRCLQSLYNSPTARIKINGDLTDTLQLERGCRQGCPLSPTLFALFIEPLAQAIRESKDIRGVLINDITYKVGLYTDDILITLTNPEISLPNLFSLLKIFGMYSGYKLNLQKTQILLYNYRPSQDVQKIAKFNWSNTSIKYLGIHIPIDLSDLYECNYVPLTSEIKADLQRWSLLPMNMHNRIDIIKMNLLPKLLYLFQALPIQVPSKQFNEWNRMISNFIWAKQKPRIKFQTLQLQRDKGGFALPCLEDYYRAAQLRVMIGWCDPMCEAKWKEIDQSYCEIPLQSLLGDQPLIKRHIYADLLPALMKVPIEIWHKILKYEKTEKSARTLRWPAYDSDFAPANKDKRFIQWLHKGITGYWKITDKNVLKDYQRLQRSFYLERQDFFRYLQLRHHYDRNIKFLEEEDTGLVKIFLDSCKGNAPKKQISRLYKCLQTSRNNDTTYIKTRWEKDAEIIIHDDNWFNMCKAVVMTSSSGLWREFAWKNTVRFFVTPNAKSKQNKDPDKAQCWRNCGSVSAGHFHIFWECAKIVPYWLVVITEINTMMGLNLAPDFTVFYLCDLPQGLRNSDKYLLLILLAGAKKAITRKWLNVDPPSSLDWIGIIKEIYTMERLTFSLRLAADKFEKYWKKWDLYSNGKIL